jgi:hypothetical protein
LQEGGEHGELRGAGGEDEAGVALLVQSGAEGVGSGGGGGVAHRFGGGGDVEVHGG